MVEFVVNDEMVKEVLPSRERIIEVLESVGFDAERQALPVASLSGEHAWGLRKWKWWAMPWGMSCKACVVCKAWGSCCNASSTPDACPAPPSLPPLPQVAGR